MFKQYVLFNSDIERMFVFLFQTENTYTQIQK